MARESKIDSIRLYCILTCSHLHVVQLALDKDEVQDIRYHEKHNDYEQNGKESRKKLLENAYFVHLIEMGKR